MVHGDKGQNLNLLGLVMMGSCRDFAYLVEKYLKKKVTSLEIKNLFVSRL